MDAFPYLQTKVEALPLRERPAYRVASNAEGCNLAELLAVLIGGREQIEITETLIARFGSLGGLANAHPDQIAEVRGIGKDKAMRIKAALGLARKLLEPQEQTPGIRSPKEAAQVVIPYLLVKLQEHLVVIELNARNRVQDVQVVYRASLNMAQVRVAEVFRHAVQTNACAIILAHNHPSGDASPSPEDVSLTRVVIQAGKLLDIEVLDHLVIGQGNFVSMKEKGLGFE